MSEELVRRRVTTLVEALLAEEPVIALHGPRSVGKSTVLTWLANAHGVSVIDLDDIEVREAVAGNLSVIGDGPTPLCIDEYQRVPEVLDAVKARLNHDGTRPGIAVITGSTRQDTLPRYAQALTGRLHPVPIWPLTQGELAGVEENLIATLMADPQHVLTRAEASVTTRAEYAEAVCAGGLPLALRRTATGRARWFDDYIRQSIERDAADLAQVRARQALADLLCYVASQTGQILNVAKAAEAVRVDWATAESHLRLLEDLFLVVRLPAWGSTLRSRVTVRPKIHVVDSGLAARLLRLTPTHLAGINPTALTQFGGLLETFVVGQVRAQASWLAAAPLLGHWRTSDGAEVDLVVEADDGAVIAFEVKASDRASGEAFAGLRQLRDYVGSRFVAGVMLTTGRRVYEYGDRLFVLPIDRLWTQ